METFEDGVPVRLGGDDFVFVNEDACNGCGMCSKIAPATFFSEAVDGKGESKANGEGESEADGKGEFKADGGTGEFKDEGSELHAPPHPMLRENQACGGAWRGGWVRVVHGHASHTSTPLVDHCVSRFLGAHCDL